MVGAVKKWQKSDPQNSLETWKKLSEANSTLEIHLDTLSKLAEINFDDYKSAIIKCSRLTSEKVHIMAILLIPSNLSKRILQLVLGGTLMLHLNVNGSCSSTHCHLVRLHTNLEVN